MDALIEAARFVAIHPQTRLTALRMQAHRLADLVRVGKLARGDAVAALMQIADNHARDLIGHGCDKIEQTISEIFAGRCSEPEALVCIREIGTVPINAAKAKPCTEKRAGWRANVIDAKSLSMKHFRPLQFVVPGLIPSTGITLLCAKPKVGKSWLLLDLCIGATMDRFVLGDRKPVQGHVLYLALEDSERRLQSRLRKLLPGFTGDWPASLLAATQWRKADQGGLDDIRDWVGEVRGNGGIVSFVAVDVLKRIRPAKGRSQRDYDSDYESIEGLHRLSIELDVPIIVVHHTRKAEADDLMDKVSGTQGLAGAVDTIIVIDRRAQGTVFDVRGRDVESDELAVEFNKATCRWTILGPAGEVHRSAGRARILAILAEAKEPLGPRAVTELVAGDSLDGSVTALSHDNVRQILIRMARNGEVMRHAGGKYSLP
jgi:hypothetical protein